MIADLSLADLVPLWRTLREPVGDGHVTALVTHRLDYLGALELATRDLRFRSDEEVAKFGEALRSLVGSLDDDCSLFFLYRVSTDVEADVSRYEGICANAEPAALLAYVRSRADFLRERKLRSARLYLFFAPQAKATAAAGSLAVRLSFADPANHLLADHDRKLQAVKDLRDRLVSRFAQMDMEARELSIDEVQRIHYELLNPGRERPGLDSRRVPVREDLWSEDTIRAQGEHLREYSEAEQLCFEDVEEHRGHLRHGQKYRRALTLKVLPEGSTSYLSSARFLSLATRTGEELEPFAYTVAVAVHVTNQASARAEINRQHQLVSLVGGLFSKLKKHDVDREVGDVAKQSHIQALFAELHEMSSKLVALSVTVLLEADSLGELEVHTEAARTAFAEMGNSELLAESVSQLPAFLSVLPGSAASQHRKKGCTSRNAGDLLPVFGAWKGCSRPESILFTPEGDLLRFGLFEKALGAAHHGLVMADSGSGKSVSLGALTLDALATGVSAILVDNGGSWRAMTELMGGTHIDVNLRTSISPFASYEQLGATGTISDDDIEEVVRFLQVCVSEPGQPAFGNLQTDLISRAVRHVYDTSLRKEPKRRPLMSDFRAAIQEFGDTQQDRALLADIARRLNIFCDGLFGGFLNRESSLRYDARLLTFDMAGVSSNPIAKKVAMATVMQAIGNRAAKRSARTLVEIDEAHEYLGTDEVAEKFLASCYRKMRKFDVWMWLVTQGFGDVLQSDVGNAIIGNTTIKLFLRHQSGHDRIAEFFKLTPRARKAFEGLQMKPGYYSDIFLTYGPAITTARLALHPLAYWMLTTDAQDKQHLARTAAKNPGLDQLTLLTEVARRHPNGIARPPAKSPAI